MCLRDQYDLNGGACATATPARLQRRAAYIVLRPAVIRGYAHSLEPEPFKFSHTTDTV